MPADEDVLREAVTSRRQGRGVLLGALAIAVVIPVVAVALLVAGVTAPRLTIAGSGGEYDTRTTRVSWFFQVTNDGLRPVTVTSFRVVNPDGSEFTAIRDLVTTSTMVPARTTASVPLSFAIDCLQVPPASTTVGFTSTASLPHTEITTTGAWPWHTVSTVPNLLATDELGLYCHPETGDDASG